MQRETRGGGQGGGGAKKNSVEERGGFASKTEQDPRKKTKTKQARRRNSFAPAAKELPLATVPHHTEEKMGGAWGWEWGGVGNRGGQGTPEIRTRHWMLNAFVFFYLKVLFIHVIFSTSFSLSLCDFFLMQTKQKETKEIAGWSDDVHINTRWRLSEFGGGGKVGVEKKQNRK